MKAEFTAWQNAELLQTAEFQMVVVLNIIEMPINIDDTVDLF